MSDKLKNIICVVLAAVFLFGFSAWAICKPATDMSDSERRELAKMPKFNFQTITNGKFMSGFEDYATDQFPLRDTFRSFKAYTAFYAFRHKNVNGIYFKDGYLSKQEYPLNESALANAASKFTKLYDKNMKNDDVHVYFSIVPDKNYFMAAECGALALDYEALVATMKDYMSEMEYVDIFDLLELEDYYLTDTHWRQEKIVDVAQRLTEAMGTPISGNYKTVTLDAPFYGVYSGQSALGVAPETIYYLTNDVLDGCIVYDYETNPPKELGIYDLSKAEGKDAYEIFLSGSKSLLKVVNPAATTDKKLVVFRDSFGSSLVPLLVEGYAEIDIVDIRYIMSDMVPSFVDFENCDVLFLYSTLVLNQDKIFK